MEALNRLRWPLSSIAGILVIVFYCVFTFIAAALFPLSWSPFPYLSDFGNSISNPNGAFFYNLACILTGIILFPFYIGLYKWYTREQWRKVLLIVTQIIGMASGFALIMIGVFNEDFGAAHILWSDVFFFLNLLVLIFANISLITHPKFIKPVAIYGFIVAAINLAFVFLTSSSIVEWFTVFTALGYAGLLVINMLKAIKPTAKAR
jgi:hypothetical membrane protein